MKVDMLFSVGKEAKNIWRGAIDEEMKEEAAFHFENNEELINVLEKFLQKGDAVLIKASRGMKFEQIAEAIEQMM
jgi:UDP-N-acetylmuramoyl-tripeptide--D-alanyl-D-alanine ligase